MRHPSLRAWPPPLAAGEDTYQEFTAGTVAVKRVVTDSAGLARDHRARVGDPSCVRSVSRRRPSPRGNPHYVDYTVTWTGMTGGETRLTGIRVELRIDGLRARPRLVFHGVAMTPLCMLTGSAGRTPSSRRR
jgi:hypothetical protein